MSACCPDNLRSAYNWTNYAGELNDLKDLNGKALDAYCKESASNAREHGHRDVTASALIDLHGWLRRNDE